MASDLPWPSTVADQELSLWLAHCTNRSTKVDNSVHEQLIWSGCSSWYTLKFRYPLRSLQYPAFSTETHDFACLQATCMCGLDVRRPDLDPSEAKQSSQVANLIKLRATIKAGSWSFGGIRLLILSRLFFGPMVVPRVGQPGLTRRYSWFAGHAGLPAVPQAWRCRRLVLSRNLHPHSMKTTFQFANKVFHIESVDVCDSELVSRNSLDHIYSGIISRAFGHLERILHFNTRQCTSLTAQDGGSFTSPFKLAEQKKRDMEMDSWKMNWSTMGFAYL